MESNLRYILGGGSSLSLNPEFSDYTTNQTILTALVGTLVKFGKSGQLEPYLARRWNQSEDRLVWTFEFRDGLKAQDGVVIDAESFAKNLRRRLFEYSKTTRVIEFEKLTGWKKLIDTQDPENLDGVKALNSLTLQLAFETEPEFLLDFLRMPYFGFYSPKNFANGKWKADLEIISSGAYQLVSAPDSKTIHLELRKDWFAASEDSIKTIDFHSMTADQGLEIRKDRTIILLGTKPRTLDGFKFISGPPTILRSLVLSPYMHPLFKNQKNRAVFRDKFRRLQSAKNLNSENSKFSNFIYSASTSESLKADGPIEFDKSGISADDKIEISLARFLGDPEQKFVFETVDEVFKGTGISIVKKTPGDGPEYEKLDGENRFFDIRVAGVDVGDFILNSTIKMMFCSKMGISFPDPNNSICNLVDEQDRDPNAISHQEYVDRFNKIIHDEAVVIPMFHSSLSWLYSNDIDPQTINPIPNYPCFEDLRFVK